MSAEIATGIICELFRVSNIRLNAISRGGGGGDDQGEMHLNIENRTIKILIIISIKFIKSFSLIFRKIYIK